jgi:transposase
MADAMPDARQEGGSYRRIELITGERRRRQWTAEVKARIVAESFEEGANISEVARRNGVVRGLLTVWRHKFATAAGVQALGFVPVRIACEAVRRRRPSRAAWRRRIRRRRGSGAGDAFDGAVGASGHPLIALRPDLKVVLAAQPVDFRKSLHTLSALVSEALRANPYCGDVFVFRSKRRDRVKLLAWDGSGMVLVTKWLHQGRFTWPPIRDGVVHLTATQLAMLLDGLEWTRVSPKPVKQPAVVG